MIFQACKNSCRVHRVMLFSNDSTNLSTWKRKKERTNLAIVKRSFIDVSHYAVVALFENSVAIPSGFLEILS